MHRAAALLGLALAACSSPAAHPPELGNCVPGDGGSCSFSTFGDAGRVYVGVVPPAGTDAGTAASGCTVAPADALCVQCANARCCGPLDTCSENLTCQNLANCVTNPTCLGDATCQNQCFQTYAGAATTYQELTACLSLDCAVCDELGAGDPCVTKGGTACNPGLTCNGQWCTKSCSSAADCEGLGPGGSSTLGLPNACIGAASGNTCVPGCVTDSDCAGFAATYCVATTSADRQSVRVCAASP